MFHLIDFSDRELVCFTGGGGKTTLMLALALHLRARGQVVVTTTTRMADDEADPSSTLIGSLAEPRFRAEVTSAAVSRGQIFVFRERDNDKYVGDLPESVSLLFEERGVPFVLVEADGARRLPLKGYAEYEPPLPERFGWQMIVLGADALLRPMNERTVARFDIARRLLDIGENEFLTPALLVKLLTSKSAYLKNSPSGVKRVLCVNKAELMDSDSLETWVRFLYSNLDAYWGIGVTGRGRAGSFLPLPS
jgi:probable selenium-dependent hydroxylase accessory protein YqeC